MCSGIFLGMWCWPSHLSYSVAGDHMAVTRSSKTCLWRQLVLSHQDCRLFACCGQLEVVTAAAPTDCSGIVVSYHFWKIWLLLPALHVLPFDGGGRTRAWQGWDRHFFWKAGLAYTVMKLCLGRMEANGICCLREKIQNKIAGVMERVCVKGNFQLSIRKSLLATDFCWCVE